MLLLCWNVKFFFWRDLHCTSACLDLDAPFGKSFSLLSSSRVGAVFPEPFKLCIYCERAALVMTQYRGSAMLGLRPLCIVKKEYGSGTIELCLECRACFLLSIPIPYSASAPSHSHSQLKLPSSATAADAVRVPSPQRKRVRVAGALEGFCQPSAVRKRGVGRGGLPV